VRWESKTKQSQRDHLLQWINFWWKSQVRFGGLVI
jgi:hypothetical protein